MKKSFMTRILATGLSFAMAFSMAAVTSVTPASAASKPVLVDAVTGGSGRAVTVNVGEVAKLKVNAANSKTYAVSSVKKSSKKIKTAVNKKGTVVYVRGVAETGEKDSAIRVSFKVKKTGKISKFTFASKVKVVSPKPAVAELTEVTQKESKKLAVTLSTAVEKVSASNFKIVRKSGSVVIPVKSAKLDDAKTGVTVETFADMKDGQEYIVTYTADDEAKTESSVTFTATSGVVADLALNKSTIIAGESTEVKVQTLDATGVLLDEYTFTNAAANKMSVTITATKGYKDGDKIYLSEVGATATVKVDYHTYKMVDGKEEGFVTREFTVTAVAEDATTIDYGYSVGTTRPNFKSASYKQNISVTLEDTNLNIYFNFKNAAGTNKNKGYVVSSSDPAKMSIPTTTLQNDTASVAVKGVAEGSAYVLVKDSKGNLITTLPINVVAKRVPTTIELDKNAVELSVATAAAVTANVKVTVKDQYGNKYGDVVPTLELVSKPTNARTAVPTATQNKITIVGHDYLGKEGSYTYKVKYTVGGKTAENYLYVNAVINNTTAGENYDIVLSNAAPDLKVDEATTATTLQPETSLNIMIGKFQGGVLVDYQKVASISAITIKHADGTTAVKDSDITSTGALNTATQASIKLTSQSGDAIRKNLKTGDWTVEIKTDDGKILHSLFTVSDTQTSIEVANVKTDAGSNNSITSVLNNKDYLKLVRDGVELVPGSDYSVFSVDQVTTSGSKETFVKSVKIKYTIHGANKVFVDVPVNQTFYSTNAWS